LREFPHAQVAILHDSDTESPTEKTPSKRPRGGRRFTEANAKEMAAKAAAARREKAARATERNASVLVPLELQDVIAGLRDKAKQGNAPAAAQLLAYLTRFPVQQGGEAEEWRDLAIEDMTPDQLAFAEAWALRQVNRALRKAGKA